MHFMLKPLYDANVPSMHFILKPLYDANANVHVLIMLVQNFVYCLFATPQHAADMKPYRTCKGSTEMG